MKRSHGNVYWFLVDWWHFTKRNGPIRAIGDAIGCAKWRATLYDD